MRREIEIGQILSRFKFCGHRGNQRGIRIQNQCILIVFIYKIFGDFINPILAVPRIEKVDFYNLFPCVRVFIYFVSVHPHVSLVHGLFRGFTTGEDAGCKNQYKSRNNQFLYYFHFILQKTRLISAERRKFLRPAAT